jgi:hypothetical protein
VNRPRVLPDAPMFPRRRFLASDVVDSLRGQAAESNRLKSDLGRQGLPGGTGRRKFLLTFHHPEGDPDADNLPMMPGPASASVEA